MKSYLGIFVVFQGFYVYDHEAYNSSTFAYSCQSLLDVSISGLLRVCLTLRYAPFPSAFDVIVSNNAVEVKHAMLDSSSKIFTYILL